MQDFRVGEGLGVCSRSLALHVEASLLLLLFLCSGACLLHPLHFERREESAAKQGLVCSTLFSKTCTHTDPHDAWRCTRSLHLAGRKELANSRTRGWRHGIRVCTPCTQKVTGKSGVRNSSRGVTDLPSATRVYLARWVRRNVPLSHTHTSTAYANTSARTHTHTHTHFMSSQRNAQLKTLSNKSNKANALTAPLRYSYLSVYPLLPCNAPYPLDSVSEDPTSCSW